MIVFILSNFLILLNFSILLSKTLKFRYHLKKTVYIVFCAAMILYLINNSGISPSKTIAVLFIYLILTNIISQEHLFKNTLIYFCFCIFSFVSEIISVNIMNLILGLNDITIFKSFETVVAILLSNLILFLLCYIFVKLYSLYNINSFPKFSWIVLILPATTLMLILNINEYFYLFRDNVMLTLIVIGLVISNFITIFIFYINLSSIQYKNELTIAKINETHYKKLYALLNDHHRYNFNFLHDILKKAVSLKKDFDVNNYSSVDSKLKELVDISFKQFNMIFSNSATVNMLINENVEVLNKNNISFSSTLEYTNFSFLTDFDEFRLFDGLIQLSIKSAIENTNNKKDIILKTKEIHRQIIIKSVFPKANPTHEFSYLLNELNILVKKYDGLLSIEDDITSVYKEIIIVFPNIKNTLAGIKKN